MNKRQIARLKRLARCFEYQMGIKQTRGCGSCGEKDPRVLEYDHRDPAKKSNRVSNMSRNGTFQSMQKEIEKCDVFCANCHRRRTVKERKHYMNIFNYVSEEWRRVIESWHR